MTGQASWITLALLLIGAGFVLVLVAVGVATKGFRRVWLSVECPVTSQTATVVALQSETSGRYTDVARCSELEGDATCSRSCLTQVNPLPRTS